MRKMEVASGGGSGGGLLDQQLPRGRTVCLLLGLCVSLLFLLGGVVDPLSALLYEAEGAVSAEPAQATSWSPRQQRQQLPQSQAKPPPPKLPPPPALPKVAPVQEPGCSRSPLLRAHASWTPTNRAAATRCLANKTIYFLGNSVTRHWAFTLADILAEGLAAPEKMPPVMREQQKQKCGRGGKWKGKRPDGGTVLPGDPSHCTWGVERRAEFSALGPLAGCFLALGSGLWLAGPASASR